MSERWVLHERHDGGARRGASPGLFDEPTRCDLFEAAAFDVDEVVDACGRRPRLVYIDPPFATNREFTVRLSAGPDRTSDSDSHRPSVARVAYSDRWVDGLDGYLAFMERIVAKIYAVLTDDGSMLLHCDQRAAPYLAIACDRIFGRGERVARGTAGFRGELIWHYGLGGSSPRSYPRKHDTILWYSKSSDWFFDPPMVPARSQRMAGRSKKMPDVLDIPSLNNMAKERSGYPTQKPLELLELLIKAHSELGDLVLDCFCGSGTAGVAAARHGRDAVLVDQSDDAIAMTRERIMGEAGAGVVLRLWRATAVGNAWQASDKPWHEDEGSEEIAWRSYPGRIDTDGVFVGDERGEHLLVRTLDGRELIRRR